MAQVTSDHIWYPAGYPGPAYDVRHVISWHPLPYDATLVMVRFAGDSVFVIEFNRVDFETAKLNSLDNGG